MNIAVIFAGGFGQRMHNQDKPKQFLIAAGKPIIVHTAEIFNEHPEIDGIIVVCIRDWIPYMERLVQQYGLPKVKKIVPGGISGQMSIYCGLKAAAEIYGKENVVTLIHDGVRPLIDQKIITDNIAAVRACGSAITCAPTTETFILVNDDYDLLDVPDRSLSWVAKAPQSFWLKDVLEVQEKAISDGYTNVIDTCTLMWMYGRKLHLIKGSGYNIKITTPEDFQIFQALYESKETSCGK